jgi:GNAT superfamily N-acetyltransferase
MTITQGTTADYKTLSQFHYRESRLPPPKKIFTLKRKGELAGVIVYSNPPPMCFGRAKVWKGNIQKLNKEIATISRVVVHPKYRSIGLGERLVAETLPLVGTHVETVAVMAKYNPFFERAGMKKIAESQPSKHITAALEELEKLGFDTALLSATSVSENKIEQIGTELVKTVLLDLSKRDAGVRRRLVNIKNVYPKQAEFVEKIAQLTLLELAVTLKKLGFIAQSKIYLFWS